MIEVLFVIVVFGGFGMFLAWLTEPLRGVRRDWSLPQRRRPSPPKPGPPVIHPPDTRPYPWRPWS